MTNDGNSENMQTVIEARNLTMGYDGEIILENLNFHVNDGEIFGILGASGCGKSTIMKHMIGLSPPISGDVTINGRSVIQASKNEWESMMSKFGVLYQTGALFSTLTLEENVAMPLRNFTPLREDLANALAKVKLAQVGLNGCETMVPAELSGGMRKRASLARAMALDPDILFFDEPSAGLDPIASAELDRLILKLRDTLGTTMVIVSHELDSVFSVADRVIIIDRSRKGVVAEGRPQELLKSPPTPWVKEFLTRSSMKGLS